MCIHRLSIGRSDSGAASSGLLQEAHGFFFLLTVFFVLFLLLLLLLIFVLALFRKPRVLGVLWLICSSNILMPDNLNWFWPSVISLCYATVYRTGSERSFGYGQLRRWISLVMADIVFISGI